MQRNKYSCKTSAVLRGRVLLSEARFPPGGIRERGGSGALAVFGEGRPLSSCVSLRPRCPVGGNGLLAFIARCGGVGPGLATCACRACRGPFFRGRGSPGCFWSSTCSGDIVFAVAMAASRRTELSPALIRSRIFEDAGRCERPVTLWLNVFPSFEAYEAAGEASD